MTGHHDDNLIAKGLPAGSYFRVVFRDNTEQTEHETNWSSISREETVEYFGGKRLINVCMFPVKTLEVFHEGMHDLLEVPEGYDVYQGLRAETLILGNGQHKTRIIGRFLGLVKDGAVVEERFLDALQGAVQGLRK